MLKRSVIFVACIVLVFATGALAQGDTALSAQAGNRHGVSAAIGAAGPGLDGGGIVTGIKGRPFSADIINETDQSLSDGNHTIVKCMAKFSATRRAARARKWSLRRIRMARSGM